MNAKLLALVYFFVCGCSLAFSDNKVDIVGSVYDSFANEPLIGATVKLLNSNDSSFVAAVIAESTLTSGERISKSPDFILTLPDKNKSYIVVVSYLGYDNLYKSIDSTVLGLNKYKLDLGKLRLSPMSKKLNEVVVSATKIKFYNRGDTLVYNADAFNLSDGSMLDALIRQLPDVKLTQQGEIFVAGEKIESLILDGKDFFKDNRQLMLDNLGAYMVKNVEVYKKAGFESEVSGRDTGDRQLVMDVKLKKEFNVGLIGNVETGYGTKDRYLARIFTGAFTKSSRLAIYANANNVNAIQAPEPDVDWRPESMPTGSKKMTQAGVKYWYDSEDGKWSVFTGGDFSHVSDRDGIDTYRTNYLNSGDTYETSFRRSQNKVLEVKTINTITFKNLKGYGLQFMPEGSYSHWNRNADEAMASFTEKIKEMSSDIIKDIYDGNHGNIIKYLINRDIEYSKQRGDSWNIGGNLIQTFTIPNTSDQLTVRLYGKYQNRKDDRVERFDINYGDDALPANSARRYYKNYPDFGSNIFASAKYIHFFNKDLRFTFTYEYEHNYKKITSDLYRLDMIDIPENDFIGILPSAEVYKMTLDDGNSYLNRTFEDLHRVIPRIEKTGGNLGWWCEIPINFSRNRLHYIRGSLDSKFIRNYVYINHGYFGLSYNKNNNLIRWQGTVKTGLPDMVSMVEMTDATDPLNIIVGNPDLKQSTEFNTYISYRRNFKPNTSLSLKCEYQELFNALARGYFYDSSTGVRKSSMYNVDGNRFFKVGSEFNIPIGKILYFRNAIEGQRITSVDLVGADSKELFHNKVKSIDLRESLTLSANFTNHSVYVAFDGSFRNYSANLVNFNSQDTWTFRTGLGAILNLPFNFQLSTDFSVYNRRGFTDNALNTDNYVWNARLTYKVMKNSLLFMIDGYDMLKNISNVSYSINAQSRTEIVRMVLPSYLMFHIQWRFNRQPQKR